MVEGIDPPKGSKTCFLTETSTVFIDIGPWTWGLENKISNLALLIRPAVFVLALVLLFWSSKPNRTSSAPAALQFLGK